MIDFTKIKKYTKDLLPETFDDGIFVEAGMDNKIKALFDVTYSNLDPENGELRLKPNVSIKELKSLPEGFRHAVFMISNNGVTWETADYYEYPKAGTAFRKNEMTTLWFSEMQIGLTLKRAINNNTNCKYKENKKPDNYELSPVEGKQNKRFEDSKKSNSLSSEKAKDNTSSCNICYKDNKKVENALYPKADATIVNALSLPDASIDENAKNKLEKQVIEKDASNIYNSVQYLISGHDGETFFFDGSPTNKTGASFKIEYDSKTMKGEFSLIVDFNNLKAINPGFRRCVIKMVNNEASIKEASSFIMIEKGQAHYSEQDKVWMVDKPLVIKLLK